MTLLQQYSAASDSLFLVACSGGADSLALAATVAFLQRKYTWKFGAVVIDHQLQSETAEATIRTIEQLEGMNLAPLIHRKVQVAEEGEGIEAAARQARYQVFEQVLKETGAAGILLGHTKDDQAEQVLLGLSRGSGTRSLSGIPPTRDHYLRPLLELNRQEIEQICEKEGLDWWEDPSNQDPKFLRNRIRHDLMPQFQAILGETIVDNLTRTAQLCRDDADLLDELAMQQFLAARSEFSESELKEAGENYSAPVVSLDIAEIRSAPAALKGRIIALAIAEVGGEAPTYERIHAVLGLLEGSKSAGPIELPGNIQVWRGQRQSTQPQQNPAKYGKLVFISVGS